MFRSEIFPRILKELCHKIGHNADGGSAYYVVVLLSDSVQWSGLFIRSAILDKKLGFVWACGPRWGFFTLSHTLLLATELPYWLVENNRPTLRYVRLCHKAPSEFRISCGPNHTSRGEWSRCRLILDPKKYFGSSVAEMPPGCLGRNFPINFISKAFRKI